MTGGAAPVRADPGQKQDPIQRSGIPRHRVSVSGTVGAGAPPRLDQGHTSSATRRSNPSAAATLCAADSGHRPNAGQPSAHGASRPLQRISAIVSFLNPQPALSLVDGNCSSCPKLDLPCGSEDRLDGVGDKLPMLALDLRAARLHEYSELRTAGEEPSVR